MASLVAQTVKKPAAGAGDSGSIIPGSGRSPGGGNGNPLQYSCLENPMDGGTWRPQSTGSQRAGHNLATKPLVLSHYLLETMLLHI